MRALLLLTLLFLVGCAKPLPTEIMICKDDTRERRAAFTLECIESANPKSDEEPEDWIGMCEQMAEQVFCAKTPAFVYVKESRRTTVPVPCSAAKTEDERIVCGGEREPK